MDSHRKEHNTKAEENILKYVKEFGCHIGMFHETDYLPSFAHSIGLFKNYNHPEIICFGLPINLMSNIIEDAHQKIKAGAKFSAEQHYPDFLEGYKITFLDVTEVHKKDWFGYGFWFYNSWDFPCIQLVWPDKEHKYPWQTGFNENWRYKQFLLDRNPDFRFREEKNLGAFVSIDFLTSNATITNVIHNPEGDWIFLTDLGGAPENIKICCLEDIVKKDPGLNELFDLEYGEQATRVKLDDNWVRSEFEDDESE